MNLQTLIIIIILILFLVINGCKKTTEINPTTISDCEVMKNIKRDECYAVLAEKIVLNDGEKATNICSLIKNNMIRDTCYLDLIRYRYQVDKKRVCSLIEDSNWKECCLSRIKRPHIWGINPKD